MFRLKVKLTTILEYFLAILMVLECNTVYQRMASIDIHLDLMCVCVAFCLVFLTLQKGISRKEILYVFKFCGIFLIYLMLSFSKSNVTSFVMLFCFFFPLMMIHLKGKKDEFGILSIYKKISDVVVILTTLSTIIWFFTEILEVMHPNMSLRIIWGVEHTVNGVWGLFYQCQRDTTFGLGMFYRNSGIFCEAPMFSLVASFALLYEHFLHGDYNRKRIVMLSIGILSSITTTGLIMLVICFGFLYWKQIQKKKNWVRAVYIICIFIIIPIGIYGLQVILGMKSTTGSYSLRMQDYIIGIKAFLSNPITGTGFNSLSNLLIYKDDIRSQYAVKNSITGFSNSITAVLGQGGIYLFIIYLNPFIRMFGKVLYNEQSSYLAWSVSFLILFILTIFHAKFIMIYFLVSAYVICSLHKENKVG